MITDIAHRIIEISSEFSTDKEFLNKCGITNHSLITELKKGRLKSPGAEILAQIVRGTGCSGTWLLTGEGEKYEVRENSNLGIAAEDDEGNYDIANQEGIPYGLINQAFEILDRIEQKAAGSSASPLPADVELVLSRLLHTSLERRYKDPGSGG